MRIIATTVISLRALRRNKLRSFLTALGIIIGVGSVITMVSIGNGAKAQVEAQVASLGRNVISVFPGSVTTGGARGGQGSSNTLTVEDALAIKREIMGAVSVSPELRQGNQVQGNGLNWRTQVHGVDPDFLIVKQIFPDVDPVGQVLRVGNIPFRIVGVLESKGFNYFGSDQDDVVLMPYTSFMSRVFRWRNTVNNILIEASTPEAMERVQLDIADLLAQRRGDREPDFTVRNQLELAAAASKTSGTMTQLLAGIAFVSLVVGGIGIMNIMLVSVTERTREIGIRLAIGAHDRDIRIQFLIEAMILSAMGGILGSLLGIGISHTLSNLNGWPVLVSTQSIVVAVAFSAAFGIGFGFYPAHKAAKLDPIEALRFE